MENNKQQAIIKKRGFFRPVKILKSLIAVGAVAFLGSDFGSRIVHFERNSAINQLVQESYDSLKDRDSDRFINLALGMDFYRDRRNLSYEWEQKILDAHPDDKAKLIEQYDAELTARRDQFSRESQLPIQDIKKLMSERNPEFLDDKQQHLEEISSQRLQEATNLVQLNMPDELFGFRVRNRWFEITPTHGAAKGAVAGGAIAAVILTAILKSKQDNNIEEANIDNAESDMGKK